MESNELFSKLQYLMKYAGELWGGNTKISREDAEIIRACHWHLLPGQRLNLGCGECVKHALVVCISYFEREQHKWIKEEPELQTISEEDFFNNIDEIEPIKPKKKKTKTN